MLVKALAPTQQSRLKRIHFLGIDLVPPRGVFTRRGNVEAPVEEGEDHCWAFQIDAALSSLYTLATNQTLVFTPQELIDFDAGSKPGTSSNRNEGGTLLDGFNWHSRPVFYINGIGFVPEFKESLLRVAVTFHPISSSLQIKDVSVLSDYSKGILRPSPAELDGEVEGLAVQIVGFDVIDGERVWKLKNSHGEKWGMRGFFYVRRDVEDPSENFYLAQKPVYPILDGVNEDLFACFYRSTRLGCEVTMKDQFANYVVLKEICCVENH
ncbi:ervatamin-B-like [Cornus florida]|uniref:ervatamin-B-like n=1 Tax=Cornus florida TaxID=4283 RepID=UPI00289C4CD6|nr:ervatamin-B-like [Cornus florida]